ncbi:MAG: PAS domain-containing protein [Deltaproteobacteria bacterium]|nr:PAS domain-containing protein [Deltaproteobacteria bacterium]
MKKGFIIPLLEERMRRYHLPLMPLIWGATGLIICGLVALGLSEYDSAEKAVAARFNTQQLLLARQAARSIEDFLGDVADTAAFLARAPEFQSPEQGVPEEFLGTFYDSFRGRINLLFLTDPRGALVSVYPADSLPQGPARMADLQDDFRRARQAGTPLFRRASLAPSGPLAASILVVSPIHRNGEFLGVLGCAVDFAALSSRHIQPIRPGAGEAWMIDPQGNFAAHHKPDQVGRAVLGGGGQEASLDANLLNKMLQGKSGMDEFVSGPAGGTKKLIAYAPVRIGDQVWSVALAVPDAEVVRLVWDRFRNSAFLLFFMGITLLAGTYVTHKINQERIRAEEQVKWGREVLKSQERLKALFEGAPDAISIVDRDLRILMINRTGLAWSDQPPDCLIGKPCYEAFQDRSDPCPDCPVLETLRTGQPAFREKASHMVRGTKRYLRVFTFPLRKREGAVAEIVEYVKDVTEERGLQAQIIQAERLAVVGKMSANVAHEIRNPLGTIVLNAELLEEELNRLPRAETEESRNLLAVVKSELDRLREVTEEYLQFARLPEVKLERGDINEVISDLLLFLKEEVVDRKMLVVEELAPGLPPVFMDAKQLRQALFNIVKNSFEAMPDGGKLTISSALQNGHVEITIADTGTGIPEEAQELVFQPFFSTKHGGTGLGLPITAHILKEHQGTLTFKSYAGLGTFFTLRLPVGGPALEGGGVQNGREA